MIAEKKRYLSRYLVSFYQLNRRTIQLYVDAYNRHKAGEIACEQFSQQYDAQYVKRIVVGKTKLLSSETHQVIS
jgi:hypothetical protein